MSYPHVVDQRFLREWLEYRPTEGIFIERQRPLSHFSDKRRPLASMRVQHRRAGRSVGYKSAGCYPWLRLNTNHNLLCHKAAWLWMFGEVPSGFEIDHINGDKDDYRICNLRLVTRSQNRANSRLRRDNRLGVRGVSYCTQSNKFRMTISMNGVRIMKEFRTLEEAKDARLTMERELHQEFAYSARSAVEL